MHLCLANLALMYIHIYSLQRGQSFFQSILIPFIDLSSITSIKETNAVFLLLLLFLFTKKHTTIKISNTDIFVNYIQKKDEMSKNIN